MFKIKVTIYNANGLPKMQYVQPKEYANLAVVEREVNKVKPSRLYKHEVVETPISILEYFVDIGFVDIHPKQTSKQKILLQSLKQILELMHLDTKSSVIMENIDGFIASYTLYLKGWSKSKSSRCYRRRDLLDVMMEVRTEVARGLKNEQDIWDKYGFT